MVSAVPSDHVQGSLFQLWGLSCQHMTQPYSQGHLCSHAAVAAHAAAHGNKL